jgi:hypothetical protein
VIEAQKQELDLSRFKNFEELIYGVFGKGIAKHFMMPYNFKVWAHPPKMMNKEWIGERVSVVDIARVLGNVVLDRDDAGWGPNSTFKYPRMAAPAACSTGCALRAGEPPALHRRRVGRRRAKGGRAEGRDARALRHPAQHHAGGPAREVDGWRGPGRGEVPGRPASSLGELHRRRGRRAARALEEVLDVLPGGELAVLSGDLPLELFPEVVPDATRYYSLLAEVSHSEFKPVNRDTVVEDTIQGMINTKLLSESDRKDIVDAFLIERDYTYPTPSLERDCALKVLHPVARVAGHLLARAVRRVAVRGGEHGPLGGAGSGVGEPDPAGRSGERADVSGEAGC